jgi:hypothetical protein
MLLGRDQQVAVVIRILVHHDNAMFGVRQDQRRARIGLTIFGAKDAARLFYGFIDIGHAPGRPELLHSSSPSAFGS